MRIFHPFLAAAFLLAPSPAPAESHYLFSIQKPVNPENLVMVYVPVDKNCKPGRLDFAWGMSGGSCMKTPNATLHCETMRRLKPMEAVPGHKAGCPEALAPGEVCHTSFATAEEVEYVGVDPKSLPIVVRSQGSGGKCSVAAFVDVGGKLVQLSKMNMRAQVHSMGMTSATATIKGIDFHGTDGKVAATLPCSGCKPRNMKGSGCPWSFSSARQPAWPKAFLRKPRCS